MNSKNAAVSDEMKKMITELDEQQVDALIEIFSMDIQTSEAKIKSVLSKLCEQQRKGILIYLERFHKLAALSV